MVDTVRVRLATLDDIPVLVHQRVAMFAEILDPDEQGRPTMAEEFAAWVRERLISREYVGFMAEDANAGVVAGAGLWLLPWPPGPVAGAGELGYILNVYTDVPFRHRGIAQRLMLAVLDYAREQGLSTLILHASEAGRPIYQRLGFQLSNEMRLSIRREDQ